MWQGRVGLGEARRGGAGLGKAGVSRVEVRVLTEQEFGGMCLDHHIAVIGRLFEEEEE